MNKKSVLVLWIIAALLGAAVATVKISQSRGPDAVTKHSSGDRLFKNITVGDITAVTIEDHENSVTITKSESGWVVKDRGDFPADIPMLAGILDKLSEIKVGQALEAGPSYNSRFGMDGNATTADDHGLLITLTVPGKEPWTIALGKTTAGEADMMNPMAPRSGGGRYLRSSEDPDSVYVVEETFPRASANAKDWLSKDFLQVENLKSVALTAPADSGFEPWSLSRKSATADFVLSGIGEEEELIGTVVNPLKSLFSFARFEDVLSEEDAKDLPDESQARQAILTTFDGFTYTVDVAPKKSETPIADEPASSPNHLLSISVSATFPEARTPADDESEEDKAKKDEEFKKQQETLRAKLAKEQKFQGHTFEVTKWTVDALLKSRADFVQAEPTPEPIPEPFVPPKPPPLEDVFGFPTVK